MPPRITDDQRHAIREALARGMSREIIARNVGVTIRQVAAVAAHVTMGSYSEGSGSSTSVSRQSVPSVLSEKAPRRATVSRQPVPPVLSEKAPRRAPIDVPDVAFSDAVRLGADVETKKEVCWDPLSSALANPHILMVGGSGFGKTYACSCLIAELVQKRVPSIVLDYAQGFVEGALPPGFEEIINVEEINASQSGIDLNPLEILPSDSLGPVNVAQRVADTFQRVFPQLGIQQHAVLRDAVLTVLSKSGIHQESPSSWKKEAPRFRVLHEYLTELSEESSGSNRRVVQTLTAHVSTLFVFNTLRPGGRKLDWRRIIASDRVTVIQLKGLEHSLSKIVTEFLLWSLLGFVDDRGPSKMSAFIVLDEAHRLSFDAGSPVERLLREGRKFGVGVMLTSQQPTDFGALAFANTASKLIFQIDDEKAYVSRQLARKTSTHSQREIEDFITRLPCGVAYSVMGNVGRLVRIDSFETRARRWSGA